jgi:xanthine dehydrogenase large subunit
MPPSDDLAVLDARTTTVVHKSLPHDSARLHVQGAATYIDDIGEPAGTLHIAIGMANKASGKLKRLGLEAVRGSPGVVIVLTAVDIPGKNDIAPVFADEPLFVEQDVMFHGQALSQSSRAPATKRVGRRGSPRLTSKRESRRSR